MDIRTKLILALVVTSVLSMAAFTGTIYVFSSELRQLDAESVLAGEFLSQLIKVGLSITSLTILSGLIIGILLARRIRELADTIERIRHGELSLRAKIVGEDEVALLARSLNEFMDQLHHSNDIFQLGRLRVLVAEKNLANRHLLSELLANWRMRATFVSNADEIREALAAAEQYEEPIHILLLDMDVPDLQDPTFLQSIVKPNPETRLPTILIASDVDALDPNEMRSLGIQHILPVPVIPSNLMEAILDEMGVAATVLDVLPDVLLPQTEQRKILLAEDSPIIQKVTSSFLENWRHDVTIAPDGQIAVELATSQRYDLILMDLEMPRMGGIEATLAIRNAEPDLGHRVPIVALTARATKADREQCMAAGMDEYISKPVDPKVLYRVVGIQTAKTQDLKSKEVGTLTPPGAVVSPGTSAQSSQDGIIDWDAARNYTGGDKALLADLVSSFPDACMQQLITIEQALENVDSAEISRESHALQAAAQIFGATNLVNCACEIEGFAHREQFDELKTRIPILRQCTQQLIAELAAADHT